MNGGRGPRTLEELRADFKHRCGNDVMASHALLKLLDELEVWGKSKTEINQAIAGQVVASINGTAGDAKDEYVASVGPEVQKQLQSKILENVEELDKKIVRQNGWRGHIRGVTYSVLGAFAATAIAVTALKNSDFLAEVATGVAGSVYDALPKDGNEDESNALPEDGNEDG